jgi:hypothetical protein
VSVHITAKDRPNPAGEVGFNVFQRLEIPFPPASIFSAFLFALPEIFCNLWRGY